MSEATKYVGAMAILELKVIDYHKLLDALEKHLPKVLAQMVMDFDIPEDVEQAKRDVNCELRFYKNPFLELEGHIEQLDVDRKTMANEEFLKLKTHLGCIEVNDLDNHEYILDLPPVMVLSFIKHSAKSRKELLKSIGEVFNRKARRDQMKSMCTIC